MEVSVVSTKQFDGYTFPDPASKLNITDSIKLPSDIFTNSLAGNPLLRKLLQSSMNHVITFGSPTSQAGSLEYFTAAHSQCY